MFAEIWTIQRLWNSKTALLEMDAATKSGMGTEAGDKVAGVERMIAGALPVLSSGKFTNADLGGIFKGLLTFFTKGVGGGKVGSLVTGAAVQSAGGIVENLFAGADVAGKTNQSIAGGMNLANSGADAIKGLGKELENKLATTIAHSTGIDVPPSIMNPLMLKGEAMLKELIQKA